jgi:hypothetical protein
MALADFWIITNGGVSAPAAVWGVDRAVFSRTSVKTGELKFTKPGTPIDSTPIFLEGTTLTLTRNGVGYFTGQVTQVPRPGNPKGEALNYIVSDPWYDIERTSFQQQWAVTTVSGDAVSTITTTQSRVTMGQSLEGVQMNYGQVLQEVLIYMLYAVQGLAYPTTVGLNNLPAIPSPSSGTAPTFQIGTIMPAMAAMTGPYFEVTDMKCGEIIRKILRYLPDVVQWFDFTTSPPTLNFNHRANLAGATVKVVTSDQPMDGYFTSGFEPVSRQDLQVPVVICKYQQTNTIDGISYAVLTVDKFPLSGRDNDPRAFVQTVDLVGGRATYQHQDVIVQNLPVSATGTATLPWIKAHLPEIYGTASGGTIYDTAGISVDAFLGKDLDQNDAYVVDPDSAPTGFTLLLLTSELLHGAVTRWMNDSGVFAANVIMAFRLRYTGSDATTLAAFNTDAAHPNTRAVYITVMGTNAETMTYKQLTSLTPSEPVPVGYAQLLWSTLSVLHWQGSLELTEEECSGRLPIGCIFNAMDGLLEWATMNALVLGVTEDLENGKSKIKFGPTMHLGLDDLVELARANRGRIYPFNLDQRTSGQSGNDNAVIGHTRVPRHSNATPPGGGSIDTNPFVPTDASLAGTARMKVAAGQVGGASIAAASFNVGTGPGTVYVSLPYTFTSGNQKTPGTGSLIFTTGAVPASTGAVGQASGGGTFYYAIAYSNGAISGGKATSSPQRAVSSSLDFDICNGMPVGVRAV